MAVVLAPAGYAFLHKLTARFAPAKTDIETETSVKASGSTIKPTSSQVLAIIDVPSKLVIPKLDINAYVEAVGKDQTGRMDVPKKDQDVGWWKYGFKPGEIGNSVIAGHYDRKDGGPAVFYNLGDLEIGDKLEIVDGNGKSLTFRVVRKEIFKDAEFPLQEVFGETDSKYLNLITCEGSFDRVTKNYSDRLVVFTKLVK